MSDLLLVGGAGTVAKVSTVTVGGTLSGETFEIKVNGKVIASHTDADTVIATTVAGLVSTWNASTHPWATGITAVDASPDVVLTSKTSGVDFTVTLNTPGGSATFALVETTPNAGPNDWRSGDNFMDIATGVIGTIPGAADDVFIGENAPNISFGLDQSAITINSLRIPATWTGKLGLRPDQFATSADGDTTVVTAPEYRGTHLQIKVTTDVKIGEHAGANTPLGSGRINIDVSTVATVVEVQFCATVSAQAGFPSVDILANNTSTDIFIRDTALNVGIAKTLPESVSSVGDIVNDGGWVYIGAGVTMVKYKQTEAAQGELNSAATVPTINAFGTGTLVTEGDYTVTAFNIDGPTVFANNINSGNAIGTVTLDAGTLSSKQSSRARTWDTVNFRDGVKLIYDDAVVTINNLNKGGGAAELG